MLLTTIGFVLIVAIIMAAIVISPWFILLGIFPSAFIAIEASGL